MQVNTTYEPYAQEPEYIDANKALVDAVPLDGVSRVADLACGTGLLSQLLLSRKADLAICGIDLDSEQIEIAKRGFAALDVPLLDLAAFRAGARRGVCLLVGSAMTLPIADGDVDLVMMGNAIHLMPDRPAFLSEVARVLRPGGHFVFNSVFFVGTFPPGAEHTFTEWMKEAVLVLEEKNRERVEAGLPKVARVRGKGDRAFSKDWLSAEGWRDLLAGAGMTVTYSGLRNVPISQRGLELVGAYGGLAEVLMSGYPVDVASECLQVAAGRAFRRLGIDSVPRNWLEVIATKH
jgi:ubiquinone/menaquinone biosynthesis C-methylase UbiE